MRKALQARVRWQEFVMITRISISSETLVNFYVIFAVLWRSQRPYHCFKIKCYQSNSCCFFLTIIRRFKSVSVSQGSIGRSIERK
jgi:hypothetical protein